MMLCYVNVCLLWTLCVAQLSDIFQPVSFQTVTLGDTATVECHIKSEMQRRVWYKLTTGKRLQHVATFNPKYSLSTIVNQFEHRHSVKFNGISSNLSISAATWEDAGTYFCGVLTSNDIQFGSGTFLMLKGANMIGDSVIQHPESLSAQPGDSVTLSCSVHTAHCAAEHTGVMWLKNSPLSAPQIYQSGQKNQICRRAESGNPTCVYNLVMRNLSPEDYGTYYCVVTACEQSLFGNGTKLDLLELFNPNTTAERLVQNLPPPP
ncbi:signal-regulatory protein beta-2-like [Tautogolabrus adspersus]